MLVRSPVQGVARRVSERLLLARKRFPFAANVVLLSGGASLGHCFTLAAAPILTRLYVPSDVGTLGLFTAFLGVAAVVASLQYDVAIVSADTEKEAAYLVKLSLICAIPMSAGCGILIHEMSRRSLLGFGALPWYAAWLMVASILFAALFSTLRYWSLRNEQFGTVSQGLLFQNAGRSLAQVALGAIGFHALGLLLGETIGRAIGMGRMVRIAWPVVRQYPLNGRRSGRRIGTSSAISNLFRTVFATESAGDQPPTTVIGDSLWRRCRRILFARLACPCGSCSSDRHRHGGCIS